MNREKEVLFISSKCRLNTIRELLEEKQKEGTITVTIALDKRARKFLDTNDVPYKTFSDYIETSDTRKETIEWLNEWSERKIGDRSFQERLSYEGMSLWGFFNTYLFYEVEKTFAYIDKIQHIIDIENPIKIATVNPAAFSPIIASVSLESIIIAVAVSKGIQIHYLLPHLSSAYLLHPAMHKSIFFLRKLWSITRKSISRVIISISLISQPHEDNPSGSILFLSFQRNWNRVYDPATKTYRREDIYIHPLIKELKRKNHDYKLIAIDTYYNERRFGWRNLWLNTLFDEYPNMVKKLIQRAFWDKVVLWKSFYCYDNRAIRQKVKQASSIFNRKWMAEVSDKKLQQSLNYKGVRLWPLIQHIMTVWVPLFVEEDIELIECAKAMIKAERPASIVIVFESGPYGMASIIASNLKGIPTVALQHGLIHPRHFLYMHHRVTTNLKEKPIAVPIPTKTAVYGNCVKDVLTKVGHYPEESVVVTGQPRYDLLAKADEIYDKEEICKTLGLNFAKRIVLLILSSYLQGVEDPREVVASAIIATSQFDDAQLVIKPHPGECSHVPQDVIAEMGADNVMIVPGYLNELLYISDIVINQGSTVGLEAMIMDKPVININYTGLPDQMPFVESGAALGVYQEEELPLAIRSVFEDEELIAKIKIAREHFVYEHAYKQDGKATERVVRLILEMVEEHRGNKK